MKILVTGATDGIGLKTAEILSHKGHKVVLHGRNEQKLQDLILQKIGFDYLVSDFSSMDQVLSMAKEVRSKHSDIQVLINNAGVYMEKRLLTADGFETTLAVNHLAPFLLTTELLDMLKTQADARIITVASVAHHRGVIDFSNFNLEKNFSPYAAYANSKLANVLFASELAKRLGGSNISSFSLHPGVIDTKLLRAGFNIQGANVNDGARTSVFLTTESQLEKYSGEYFENCKPSQKSVLAQNQELAKQLWEYSRQALSRWIL